jgi:hypothetical protein
MKKFLAVCAFLALSGAAMAYDVTTSFKGTVDVKFNWVNFSEMDEFDYTNCNDWVNFPVKYDAYLVLCYDRILCPVCPFEIEEAFLWLVDKKSKQVFFSELGYGITEAQGFCFGDGNVGVSLKTFLPYLDLADFWEFAYATSPEVRFVLTGGREKYSSKGPANILNLNGGIAMFDITYPVSTAMELECDDASETLFANVSFKKNSTKVKADPYCPECATDCWSIYLATEQQVYKASKKFFWWTIEDDDTVVPFYDVLD